MLRSWLKAVSLGLTFGIVSTLAALLIAVDHL